MLYCSGVDLIEAALRPRISYDEIGDLPSSRPDPPVRWHPVCAALARVGPARGQVQPHAVAPAVVHHLTMVERLPVRVCVREKEHEC